MSGVLVRAAGLALGYSRRWPADLHHRRRTNQVGASENEAILLVERILYTRLSYSNRTDSVTEDLGSRLHRLGICSRGTPVGAFRI